MSLLKPKKQRVPDISCMRRQEEEENHLLFEPVRFHPYPDRGIVQTGVESFGGFREPGRVDKEAVRVRERCLPKPVPRGFERMRVLHLEWAVRRTSLCV